MTMVMFAAISLASNLLLPLIITTNSTSSTAVNKTAIASVADAKFQLPFNNGKPSRWSITRFRIKIPWLSLPRAWAVSQLFTSIILLTTIFTQSSLILTAQVSLLGISWAMTQWAPLALISTQMSNYESAQNGFAKHLDSAPCHGNCDYCSKNTELSIFTCYNINANKGIARTEDDPQPELRAGAVMGIYNVSIAAPQILAAVGSGCLLWIFGRLGIDDGEAVGWVIGLGGLSSLAAAWLTIRIEGDQDNLDDAER
jgi:solute carrier family 45 protein 1/2/4